MFLFQLEPDFRSALFNIALMLTNNLKRPLDAIPYLRSLLEVNTLPKLFYAIYIFLAHLSQRLIGELIVYPCSGVRPSSVRRPQFQRSSSLKPLGRLFSFLHIHHLQVGGKNNCVFCFDRIRTLVTMVTYASHRLIMEKSENCQFLLSCWRYLNFVFAEMFIE